MAEQTDEPFDDEIMIETKPAAKEPEYYTEAPDWWPETLDDGEPVREGDQVIFMREDENGEMVPHIVTAGPGGMPPKE